MRALSLVLVLICVALGALADLANLPFYDCFSGNAAKQVTIDSVYGQVLGQSGNYYLNLTVLGSSTTGISGYTNDSAAGSLSTLFMTSDVLTLNVNESATYFCSTLNPSPLYAINNPANVDPSHPPRYCPLPAGPFAFSSTVPFGAGNRALTTLTTRLKALDPFSDEMFCIDILTTPVDAAVAGNLGQTGEPNGHYGQAIYIFYVSIALAITYFVMTSIARLSAAWGRGLYHSSSGTPRATGTVIWTRVQSAGYIVASAVSGERLGTSPSLLRFCTPSVKDIVLHTQFCAILAMIRVQWAGFLYPLLTQASWATLAYNITISDTMPKHYNPTNPPSLSPSPVAYPSSFADQFSDSSSPLYIDPTAANVLLVYPRNDTHDGIEKFAYTLGVRPQDMFPVALVVLLGCIAATIAVALFFWFVDIAGTAVFGSAGPGKAKRDSAAFPTSGTRSPHPFAVTGSKDVLDGTGSPAGAVGSLDGHTSLNLFRPPSKFTLSGLGGGGDRSGAATPGPSRGLGKRRWWKKYLPRNAGLSTFHLSVLHGNLVRLLALFHLPITIFSAYQLALPKYQDTSDTWDIGTSTALKALAAVSYVFFSILIPTFVMLRIVRTPTNKLFSETRTLLMLGPLYNVYSQGSQKFALMFFGANIVFGTVLGATQGATPSSSGVSGSYGLAQAIVLLVCEIMGATVNSIWLPWGLGAGMGLWSFLSSVGRIVVAVMVIILSSTVSIGPGPAAWVTYGVLVIIAMHYLAFVIGLFVKLTEGLVRIITGRSFKNSTSSSDAGLLGACCVGRRKRRPRRKGKGKSTGTSKASSHRYTKTSEALLPNPASGFAPPPKLGGGGASSSLHSGPPASVLRPEQAYKEYDSDDDQRQESSGSGGGFIMGAWKPQAGGYEPVSATQEASPSAPQKKGGFSRVGGGKANMDNPYSSLPSAHLTGSPSTPVTVPATGLPASSSLGRSGAPPSAFPSSSKRPGSADSSTNPTALPPGALPPHIRTKSQTAVVEHFAPHIPQPTSGLAAYSTPVFSSDDESDPESGPSKKKWNPFSRKKRGSSTGGIPASEVEPEHGGLGAGGHRQSFSLGETSAAPAATTEAPQRSFVVVRKGQSGSSSPAGR